MSPILAVFFYCFFLGVFFCMCLLDHFMFFLMLKVAFNKLSAISTLIVMELLPILKVFWSQQFSLLTKRFCFLSRLYTFLTNP